MLPLPPVNEIQQRQNREHLKLLAIFYFITAGLAALGIGFLFLHYLILSTVFSNPNLWKNANGMNPPPFAPDKFFSVFIWMYVFFGVVLVTAAILNVLTGLFLLRRKHRIFSVVVGALNCLQIPFGTVLGVFTIIILSRFRAANVRGRKYMIAAEDELRPEYDADSLKDGIPGKYTKRPAAVNRNRRSTQHNTRGRRCFGIVSLAFSAGMACFVSFQVHGTKFAAWVYVLTALASFAYGVLGVRLIVKSGQSG